MLALTFRRPIDNPLAYISNPYANWYPIQPGVWNYHSGIDIVSQQGSCQGWPILSVAWGVVTYAERVTVPGFAVWGNLVIVKSTLPDSSTVYCRYAHSDNLQVKAGDTVYPGQHLADVSNAFGAYPYHLHFDISPTTILATTPWDWPGADLSRVYRDYVDPVRFIQEHSLMATDYTALDAAMNNVLAAAQDMQAAVKAFETPPAPVPVDTETDVVTSAAGLSIRSAPSTSGAKFGGLKNGDTVVVTKQVVADGIYQWAKLLSVNGVAYSVTAYVCRQEGDTVYLAKKA